MQSATRQKKTGKSVRIGLKTSPEVKSELERATAISGVSLTAFVVHHAAEAAKRILEEAYTVRLNQEAWSKLTKIMSDPPEPTNELKELIKQ